MRVVRLMDEPDWQARLSPIEEIFFATSPSAKTLRPDERQPFKERWLGRYIAYDIESFFVAVTEVSTVAGYLAGCLDNPAHNPRFADIGYYASFAPLCDCYPCHLHINLDERYRNCYWLRSDRCVCRAGRERGTFGHPRRHRRAGAQCPFL
jgi:hypothetical protein